MRCVDIKQSICLGGNAFPPVQKPEEASKGSKDEPGEGGGKGGLGRGRGSHHEGRSISLIMKFGRFL